MASELKDMEAAYRKLVSENAFNEGYCKALYDLTLKTTESVDLVLATEYEHSSIDVKASISRVEGLLLDNAKKLIDLRRTENYERSAKNII